MTFRILSIDPATKMGVVVLDIVGKNIDTITAFQFDAKLKDMERLGEIGSEIMRLLEKYEPNEVWVEGYSFGSRANHEIMYSIGTVIRYFLWQSGYERNIIPPTKLKKFATGKGNSKKDLVMKSVFKYWGFDTDNDNIADAYAIALFGMYRHIGIVDEKGVWLVRDSVKYHYRHFTQEN